MATESYNLSDVFISYSRRDSDFVKKLDNAFRDRDLEVWVDYEDIPLSVDWWQEVKAGIEGADVMVFIITPESVRSDVCYDEIEHALANNKRFIPVLHKEITDDADREKMHPAVSSHNWLFFRDDDEFKDAFDKLIETIHADFSHIRRHTRLLVRAREWEGNNRDDGYLLSGGELTEAEEWLANSADKDPEPTDLHRRYIYISQKARSRRQRLIIGGVSVALVVAVGLAFLSLLLFQDSQRNLGISQQRGTEIADSGTQIASSNRELALQSTQIFAQSRQINDGAQELKSISLALNAQQTFELGDAFRALPFAIEANRARQTTLSERAIAQVSYNPGPERWLFEHTGAVNDIATSPAANIAASASNDNAVIVWDVDTGDVIQRLDYTTNVQRVAFSPDGTRLLTADLNGNIRIHDTESWGQISTLDEDTRLRGLIYRGDRLITAVPERVQLWSLADEDDPTLLYAWDGDAFDAIVTQVGFSPDARTVIIGLQDGTLLESRLPETNDDNVYDEEAETAPELNALPNSHTSEITGISFSNDGTRLLTSAQENNIRLWDLTTRRLLRTLEGHTNHVAAVAFSPDNVHGLSVSFDRRVIHWNLNTGEALQTFTGHEGLPVSVAWTNDGAKALTGSVNGGMIIWDFAVATLLRQFDAESRIQGIDYDTSGERAVTASHDGTIRVWDVVTGEAEVLGTHGIEAYDAAFVLDDTHIVTAAGGDDESNVRLWNLADGSWESLAGHTSSVFDLSTNADGTRLLTGANDSNLIYWNLDTREIIDRYRDLSGRRILTVALSPDGETAFASSNLELMNFNLTNGEVIRRYPGHGDSIISLDVSNDGTRIASGDIKDTVIIWDVATGEQEHILPHDSAIWSLDFSPGERYLAAGTSRSDAVVWDVDSGEQVRVFRGDGEFVRGMDFRADGDQLLFGSGHLHRIQFSSIDRLIDWAANNRIMYYFNCDERAEFQITPACRRNNRGRLPADTDSVQATLQPGETHVWEYEGQAGETLTIRVDAANPSNTIRNSYKIRALGLLNTVVALRTNRGELIAQNNNRSDDQSDSLIEDVTLPDAGTYRIEVGSLLGEYSGNYTLTVTSNYNDDD